MNSKDFETVIEEQIKKCKEVLIGKANEYAKDDDRLHNFKNAAGMMSCDPKEALAGMMAKHTISVYDMCRDGEQHNLDLWTEKITDHINYLLLLKAIILEENKWNFKNFIKHKSELVKPGDKVDFDCGRTTTNIEALENEINKHSKRIGELWSKNLNAQPLNSEKEEEKTGLDRWLTDPPKPGKPIFIRDMDDRETKEWAKKVADSLTACSDLGKECDECEFQSCHACDELCSYTLMKAAKNLIEQYILDSEEKND